jgi:hypothetical protein
LVRKSPSDDGGRARKTSRPTGHSRNTWWGEQGLFIELQEARIL